MAGESLPAALLRARAGVAADSGPAVQDMAYQTVRRLGTGLALARILNNKPAAPELQAIQLVALEQLISERRAPAIVIDQVVEACKADPVLRFSAGFLNAVLRRFLRERDALLGRVNREDEARYNLPDWWLELLRRDHPQQWSSIVTQSQRQAGMTLRVNQRISSVADYAARLQAAGMAHQVLGLGDPSRRDMATPAIRLEQPVDVQRLPGWSEGLVSVQDLGAQLAAPLLQVQAGHRVLDACAAPGGKSAHLLEQQDIGLVALDIDAQRTRRIGENLQRLGLMRDTVQVKVGDAAQPRGWWDGQPFDRILADVPCSASGIVARHPDIPWLRRRRDIATLSGQQLKILGALWSLLKPGGKLLVCTCSVFRDEGEYLLERAMRELRGAQAEGLTWSFETSVAVRLGHLLPTRLPSREHDGFFYARLTKTG